MESYAGKWIVKPNVRHDGIHSMEGNYHKRPKLLERPSVESHEDMEDAQGRWIVQEPIRHDKVHYKPGDEFPADLIDNMPHLIQDELIVYEEKILTDFEHKRQMAPLLAEHQRLKRGVEQFEALEAQKRGRRIRPITRPPIRKRSR